MDKKEDARVERISLSKSDFSAALDRASRSVHSWSSIRESSRESHTLKESSASASTKAKK